MKQGFNNTHAGAKSLSARLDIVHSNERAERDSAPTISKRAPRRDDLNKSSLLRTPSSSLPIYSAGFTLIELLVVVLIIAILAAVALPQYNVAVAKSKSAEAVTMLKAIMNAQERYRLQHDEYTDNLQDLDITIPNNRLWEHQTEAEKVKNYRYRCGGKRTCHAEISTQSLPEFEFHTPSEEYPGYSNKQWCVAYKSNARAVSVCKTFSTNIDTSLSGGDKVYYIMN
ncbi:prepilin-type N-terminal cleavage/methylation domain-containing protein [Parelusimicrobium proximum]|uniref:type IV pilin protein n=1 Tax=Parelusimicrobium proximum TaxID=3228953 RepID=UPI003D17FF51